MRAASAASQNMIAAIIQRLNRLPADRLPEILTFVEFIEYQATRLQRDETEDVALWAAVEANWAYKRDHSEDAIEEFASSEDFLRAMADV